MGDATYAQSSFLGGQISKWAQGRFDMPRYKIALSRALNLLLVDEGAAPRRPGFQFLGTTRNGKAGRLIPFDFAEDTPYNMEFTDSVIRFWNGTRLVTSNDNQTISSISNTSPAVFTLPRAVNWVTGDEVYFTFMNPSNAVTGAVLLDRQFIITMVTATTFTVVDSITGAAIDSADFLTTLPLGSFTYGGGISTEPISDGALEQSPQVRTLLATLSPTVNHVSEITTTYTQAANSWEDVRSVQGLELALLLHTSVSPQALAVSQLPDEDDFATFTYNPAFFQDGPYLDPPANAVATPSVLSGVIQVVVGYAAWVNTTVYGFGVTVTYLGTDYISVANNNAGTTPGTAPTKWLPLSPGGMINPGPSPGFKQTDIGRVMRLFSAPQNWNPTTTYAAGTNVAYNGSYFTSLTNTNTNNQPDISLTNWVINTSAAVWTWGVITAVTAPNTVSMQLQGGNLLYTTPCPLFRVGAWSDTTGWPTTGCYYGGRFWFGGAIRNRVDSSQPDTPFIMSPTLPDGTVTDASAISYTFNNNSVDQIFWMEPQPEGIMIGTQKGEILLSSGTSGGPITPTSIAESPKTKYGSANILPVRTGLTMCFVQRYGRRLLEYLADVFSNRFYGPDLSTYVRDIGKLSFKELAYQQEPAPIVWARMGDGSLAGTTYRRVSLFSNQEPEFNAWHQHKLGSARAVESICVGPSSGAVLDTLAMVTNDPATNIRFVETLTPLMDEGDPMTVSWFLDAAVTPGAASIITTNGKQYVRFYGLSHLNGNRPVTVFAAGIDCGDYIVTKGIIDVPLGLADPLTGYTFDVPQFNILQTRTDEFESVAVTIVGSGVSYTIPCVIGFNYQTQGQLCRPMLPQDTGARNGPGFGKKRNTSKYAINLVDSLGVRVGTAFGTTKPVNMATPMGKLPPYLSAYTGILRDTLNDDFSYDSMLCWETTRPYGATVTTLGGFIETQDA